MSRRASSIRSTGVVDRRLWRALGAIGLVLLLGIGDHVAALGLAVSFATAEVIFDAADADR